MKFIRLIIGLFVSSLLLAACGKDALPKTPLIETTEDLLTALDQAGVTVAETALLGQPVNEHFPQIFQVSQAMVHVYDIEEEEAWIEAVNTLTQDHGDPPDPSFEWLKRSKIWVSGQIIVVYPGTDGGAILLLSGLLGDPLRRAEPVVDEPYPPAVPAAINLLARTLEANPEDIQVLDFEFTSWPDTCLGLPGPDEGCYEEEMEGWYIQLQYLGVGYGLRSDLVGGNLRLE
jgi:hypothetical protein